eukprot:COSAG02_NODE_20985_length_807_cov_1.120056_2_plen_193_part_00
MEFAKHLLSVPRYAAHPSLHFVLKGIKDSEAGLGSMSFAVSQSPDEAPLVGSDLQALLEDEEGRTKVRSLSARLSNFGHSHPGSKYILTEPVRQAKDSVLYKQLQFARNAAWDSISTRFWNKRQRLHLPVCTLTVCVVQRQSSNCLVVCRTTRSSKLRLLDCLFSPASKKTQSRLTPITCAHSRAVVAFVLR